MSWAVGFDEKWQRDIGYGVPSICDFPHCAAAIDRGLSYVCCGEQPYGGDYGCGLYFCEKHHPYFKHNHGGMCFRCFRNLSPFVPKPDLDSWTKHKMTDPSWAEYRKRKGARE